MTVALVTGGAGFIGSTLVDTLVDNGTRVVVVDNESSECNKQFYYNGMASYYKVSINNLEALQAICHTYKPDLIFHLASESRIQPTLERPIDACQTNFIGTCNVLECARKHNARVIYSSTSSAYGCNKSPQVETMNTDCLNPYSVSKVAGEELCKMYYNLWQVQTVIFRYFNVYGPREPSNGPYAPVIGRFINQYKSNKPMTVVGDGLQRRDYTHVQDVVQANILASKCNSSKILGEIFNIGSGINHSILELVSIIGGKHIHIKSRLGEARETLADNTKAKTLQKWEPKYDIEKYIVDNLNTDATIVE